MKKVALYSRSTRSRHPDMAQPAPSPAPSASPAADTRSATPPRRSRVRTFIAERERTLFVLTAAMLSLFLLAAYNATVPPPRELTQKELDKAVMHTLEKNVLPSPEAKAYRIIQRSVVRVRQLGHTEGEGEERLKGVGSGVVVVANGTILTNLHVVAGAEHVQVVFSNGLVSDATVVGQQPDNDLAVLQAKNIPDDLIPATLRSANSIAPGDKVIAVGFPFGIGPSVSSGIISGLKRQYRSPEGERILSDLIQFDAAANPGNSGGPLVTMDGEVVGIVTAILNPAAQDTFIGIGFAVPIDSAAAAAGESPF